MSKPFTDVTATVGGGGKILNVTMSVPVPSVVEMVALEWDRYKDSPIEHEILIALIKQEYGCVFGVSEL